MSNTTYELKYLKYKNKYLNLKKIISEQSGSGDKCFEDWELKPEAKCGGLLSSCKELKILGNLHLCISKSHFAVKNTEKTYPDFLKTTDFNWEIRKKFLTELINDKFPFESIFKMGFYFKEVYDTVDSAHNKDKVFNTYFKNNTKENFFLQNEELKKHKSNNTPKPFTYNQLIRFGLFNTMIQLHLSKKIIFDKESVSIDYILDTVCANCDVFKFINVGYTLDDCFKSNLKINAYSGWKDLKQLTKKFNVTQLLINLDWNKHNFAQSFTLREILEGVFYDRNILNSNWDLLKKIIYDPFYGKKVITVNDLKVTEGFKKVLDEIKLLKSKEDRLKIFTNLSNKFETIHEELVTKYVFEIDDPTTL